MPFKSGEATTDDLAIERLRDMVGEAFVHWVLAEPGGSLTQAQRAVAASLTSLVETAVARTPGLPANLALSSLTGFDTNQGTTRLNLLRQAAGGDPPAVPSHSGDAVLDRLGVLARDAFGALLLPNQMGSRLPASVFVSPPADQVVEAVCADPSFPFFDDPDDHEAQVFLYRSTGSAGGLQLSFVGPSMLGAAWELAELEYSTPTFEQFASKLPIVLQQARSIATGKTATITGVVSLRGAVIEDGFSAELGWGRIRSARATDHPLNVLRNDHRTERRLDDGTVITMSDRGDIIVEVSLPLSVSVGSSSGLENGSREVDTSTAKELEARVTQVRVAHLLGSSITDAEVLLPAWSRFIEPLAQGWSVAFTEPHQYPSPTPSRLSGAQVSEWKELIERLDEVETDRLGVAPTRILRAAAERRDPSDRLIDAVIAWEALFGGDTEATLRVSAAMARLIEPPGQGRQDKAKQLKELYRLRSRIVHGEEVNLRQLNSDAQDALKAAIDALTRLVTERPELQELSSAERSNLLLLE